MQIAMIGAGGTGAALAPVLGRVLFHEVGQEHDVNFTIIDGDAVEKHNIERAYTTEDVGRNKAETLCHKLTESFGERITVQTNRHYVSPSMFDRAHREWFGDGVTVFGCVDNNKSRVFLDEKLDELNNFTYVDGGNAETDGQAVLILKRGGTYITPRLKDLAPEVMKPGDPQHNVFPDDKSCTEEYERLPQLFLANTSVALAMVNLWYSQVLVPEIKLGQPLLERYSENKALNQVLVNVSSASAHQFSRDAI